MALPAGRSSLSLVPLRDRRMARSSRGEQSSARIAAFFREPARMRPKTFPCYQNASHASCNTYRAPACFLITTLIVFLFLRGARKSQSESGIPHCFVQAPATVALQRKRCGTLVRLRRKNSAATSDGALFTAKQKRSEQTQFAGVEKAAYNERSCFCAAWRSRRSGSKMPARFRAGIRGRRLAATLVRGTGLEPT